MKIIKVRISPDGSKAEVRVEGVQGKSCTDLTKSLEDAIFGGDVTQKLTDEYFQPDEVHVSLNGS